MGGVEGRERILLVLQGKGKIILVRRTAMSPLISHQVIDIGLGEESPRKGTSGNMSGKACQDGCQAQHTERQLFVENGLPDNEDRQRLAGFHL